MHCYFIGCYFIVYYFGIQAMFDVIVVAVIFLTYLYKTIKHADN